MGEKCTVETSIASTLAPLETSVTSTEPTVEAGAVA
jgi:hypothetical protein